MVATSLAQRAASAAIGGAGSAAGRDLYRALKKSSAPVIFLLVVGASILLPFVGMRSLVRGYLPGRRSEAFYDLLWVLVGLVAAVVLAALCSGFVALDAAPLFIRAALLVSGIAAFAGACVGAIQRPGTLRRRKIISDNVDFLAHHGIKDTGETEVTHFDGEGHALRLVEETPERLVFLAVGKRNRRAYITLAPDGRMTSYSGVVTLGSEI